MSASERRPKTSNSVRWESLRALVVGWAASGALHIAFAALILAYSAGSAAISYEKVSPTTAEGRAKRAAQARREVARLAEIKKRLEEIRQERVEGVAKEESKRKSEAPGQVRESLKEALTAEQEARTAIADAKEAFAQAAQIPADTKASGRGQSPRPTGEAMTERQRMLAAAAIALQKAHDAQSAAALAQEKAREALEFIPPEKRAAVEKALETAEKLQKEAEAAQRDVEEEFREARKAHDEARRAAAENKPEAAKASEAADQSLKDATAAQETARALQEAAIDAQEKVIEAAAAQLPPAAETPISLDPAGQQNEAGSENAPDSESSTPQGSEEGSEGAGEPGSPNEAPESPAGSPQRQGETPQNPGENPSTPRQNPETPQRPGGAQSPRQAPQNPGSPGNPGEASQRPGAPQNPGAPPRNPGAPQRPAGAQNPGALQNPQGSPRNPQEAPGGTPGAGRENLSEAYQEAANLQRAVAQTYREIRAAELARLQGISQEEARRRTEEAALEEAANPPPTQGASLEQERAAQREIAAMVARAQRLLDQAQARPGAQAKAFIERMAGLAQEKAAGQSEDVAGLMAAAGAAGPGEGRKPLPGDPTYLAPPPAPALSPEAVRNALPGRRVATSGGPGADWMYVDTWYTIGPFPNPARKNINTPFPPETAVDLDAAYPGKNGKTVRWKFVQSGKPEVTPANAEEYGVYYAYTELWFDQDRDLWVAVGSDDKSTLWIDGQLVWMSSDNLKGWQVGEGLRRVHFKKGRNRLLLRCENGWLGVGLSLVVGLKR